MRGKNFWILLIFLLSGIVLGGFIGNMAEGSPAFPLKLNFGQSFGIKDPIVLDFGLLIITFGLTIRITMASIIGVALAILAYRYV